DFQIAQVYIGTDMPVNENDALQSFNADCERIVILDGGKKWFIKPFVGFQYGDLNPENRVHASVISVLEQAGIKDLTSPVPGASKDLASPMEGSCMGLTSPVLGAKEKEKDKDMVKDKDTVVNSSLKSLTTLHHRTADYGQTANGNTISSAAAAPDAPLLVSGKPLPSQYAPKTTYPKEFDTFWQAYPRKVGKAAALKRWKTQKPPLAQVLKALELQRGCAQWQDISLIPHPETWLNKRRWEDDPAAYAPAKPKTDNHAYCEADSLQGGD
ncbi:MAG TPA: hypothetical protein PLL10_08250, partial [Elusimicrobiales bacterium]|nr:hypothetical protein [Elusimicrobiales bacterium]